MIYNNFIKAAIILVFSSCYSFSNAQGIEIEKSQIFKDTLYLQSGNAIELPADLEYDKISFSENPSGLLIKGPSENLFTVFPTSPDFNLEINYEGNAYNELSFTIIEPPLPTLEANYEKNEKGLDKQLFGKNKRVVVRVIPDEKFAAQLPRDSQYRIAKFVVEAVGDSGEVLMSETYSGNAFSLKDLKKLKKSDVAKLHISTTGLMRRNFIGKVINITDPIDMEIPVY